MRWGYTCSSEEFEASELVEQAAMAEQTGFDFVTVSDHFHPWTSSQGHSPFAWTTIGGIAARTDKVGLGTGVTCPLIRYHPAVIAQAAATATELSGGRFFLGVGTGEALNEHITADRWPPANVRQEMLVEAIEIIRARSGPARQSITSATTTSSRTPACSRRQPSHRRSSGPHPVRRRQRWQASMPTGCGLRRPLRRRSLPTATPAARAT